jgi:predicted GH43/DUF377 family glycosyl hydrolase
MAIKSKYFVALFFFTFVSIKAFAQDVEYIDGRPSASLRLPCTDEGVVLKHGDGKDSCDTYGAREAIVNKVGNKYYLFYDGAGKDGWRACLAESYDLKNWEKKGAILKLGDVTKDDSKSASAPWVIKSGKVWHMFYLGTPNTTPAPNRIPSFPYLTMKARATSLEGPWIKQYNVHPFKVDTTSFYTVTSSPGFIVKYKGWYLQFFSGASRDAVGGTKRTLGLARTKNLNGTWIINTKPIFPPTEQVENSSVFFDKQTKTWYLFTNHIGITKENGEYTDAIWVYWSKDIYHWNEKDKAVVLDKTNCTWAKGAIGMPTVIKVGDKLALLYDGVEGYSTSHMGRDIGLAWINLPIQIGRISE